MSPLRAWLLGFALLGCSQDVFTPPSDAKDPPDVLGPPDAAPDTQDPPDATQDVTLDASPCSATIGPSTELSRCGNGEVLCLALDAGASCIAWGSGSCPGSPVSGVTSTCLAESDCPGSKCWMHADHGGAVQLTEGCPLAVVATDGLDAVCTNAPGAGNVQLCKTSAECVVGTCQPASLPGLAAEDVGVCQ